MFQFLFLNRVATTVCMPQEVFRLKHVQTCSFCIAHWTCYNPLTGMQSTRRKKCNTIRSRYFIKQFRVFSAMWYWYSVKSFGNNNTIGQVFKWNWMWHEWGIFHYLWRGRLVIIIPLLLVRYFIMDILGHVIVNHPTRYVWSTSQMHSNLRHPGSI